QRPGLRFDPGRPVGPGEPRCGVDVVDLADEAVGQLVGRDPDDPAHPHLPFGAAAGRACFAHRPVCLPRAGSPLRCPAHCPGYAAWAEWRREAHPPVTDITKTSAPTITKFAWKAGDAMPRAQGEITSH